METHEAVTIADDSSLHALCCRPTENSKSWREDVYRERVFVVRIPRGGRHFNLQKQTQQYDPHGVYIAKWQGNEHCDAQLDDLDAADWPV